MRKKEDARRVVETVVSELGRLDILVNGAAGNFLVAAEDLSPNGFKTGRNIWLASLESEVFILCRLLRVAVLWRFFVFSVKALTVLPAKPSLLLNKPGGASRVKTC